MENNEPHSQISTYYHYHLVLQPLDRVCEMYVIMHGIWEEKIMK